MNKEHYRKLYPDLVESGGLLSAAKALLRSSAAVEIHGFGTGQNYVHVQRGERAGQVFLNAEERRFGFDLWERGTIAADGTHADLTIVIRAIEDWVLHTQTAEEFEQSTGFVRARSKHPKSNVTPGVYIQSGNALKKFGREPI